MSRPASRPAAPAQLFAHPLVRQRQPAPPVAPPACQPGLAGCWSRPPAAPPATPCLASAAALRTAQGRVQTGAESLCLAHCLCMTHQHAGRSQPIASLLQMQLQLSLLRHTTSPAESTSCRNCNVRAAASAARPMAARSSASPAAMRCSCSAGQPALAASANAMRHWPAER